MYNNLSMELKHIFKVNFLNILHLKNKNQSIKLTSNNNNNNNKEDVSINKIRCVPSLNDMEFQWIEDSS